MPGYQDSFSFQVLGFLLAGFVEGRVEALLFFELLGVTPTSFAKGSLGARTRHFPGSRTLAVARLPWLQRCKLWGRRSVSRGLGLGEAQHPAG